LITNKGIINEADPSWIPTFRVTSFRPWLSKTCKAKQGASLQERLQITKCRDLFEFGKSIFEFLIGEK
jgi:hypothetical protein